MAVEHLIKRTIWIVRCEDCETVKQWVERPPREVRCQCGIWHKPKEESYIGPEIRK